MAEKTTGDKVTELVESNCGLDRADWAFIGRLYERESGVFSDYEEERVNHIYEDNL